MCVNDDETMFSMRMDRDKRKEWEEFVEESDEFTSTSQLVRSSVNEQINASDRDLDKELLDVNDQILQEIARLMERLDAIYQISSDIQDQTQSDLLKDLIQSSTRSVIDEKGTEEKDNEE